MSVLLETIGLKKYFQTAAGKLHAVDDINLKIGKGETLGVVGESGWEIGRASCRERGFRMV